MAIQTDWPEFTPDVRLEIQVSAGLTVSLAQGSAIANIGDCGYSDTEDTLSGAIYKNNTNVGALTFSRPGGAITASSFSAAAGDIVEVRVEYTAQVDDPWDTKIVLRRSAYFTVPAGGGSFTFGPGGTVMPVPVWKTAWGWDANDKLRVAFSITGDDGASEDMTVISRLPDVGNPMESSSVVDLDVSNPSPHVSTFTSDDVGAKVEVKMFLKSSSSSTRFEDTHRIVFQDISKIGDFPGAFPPTGTKLEQSKVSGALRLARP